MDKNEHPESLVMNESLVFLIPDKVIPIYHPCLYWGGGGDHLVCVPDFVQISPALLNHF